MSGRLLQQGVQPRSLLWQGFITMAVTSALAFADWTSRLPCVMARCRCSRPWAG